MFISPTGKGVKAFVPCAPGQSATDGIRWAMSYVHCMYDTDVHIGTAFHLAELCGVKIEYENPGAVGTVGTEVRPPSGTHTRTRVKEVYSQEKNDFSCEEETSSGSAPLSPLPTFDKNIRWPYPLEHIMSCATSDAQSDVLLLGALNVLGATMGPHVRCAYGGKMVSPCMQTFTSANSASGKGVLSLVRLLVEPFHDEIRKQVAERMVCYQRDKAKYDALGKERVKAEIPTLPPNKMFLISGTPSQVKSLIPSAENGLFSRQIFYYMPSIRQWQNQFDRNDRNLEEPFTKMGVEWKEKLKIIYMGGIFTLHLSDGQKEEFNRLFSQLFTRSELTNGSEMSGSVARLAINICRIMEVVAMLRMLESGDIATSPHLSPDPGTSADNLKDHIEEMGIKTATASTWLKRMLKNGLVENMDGKGTYQKP